MELGSVSEHQRVVENPDLVEAMASADLEQVDALIDQAEFLVPATPAGSDRWAITVSLGAMRERISWAFTDAEALAAWDRHPSPHAIVLSAATLARCYGSSGGSVGVVVVNAAGPAGHLVAADRLLAVRGSHHAAGEAGPRAAAGLARTAARVPLRRRASGEHRAALLSSADGNDVVALAHLGRAAEACLELGDRLHGAAVLREVAHCSARLGQPESWRSAESAGWLFASLGELDLALESLLEAAEQAGGSNRPQEANRLVRAALTTAAGPEAGKRLAESAAWLAPVGAEGRHVGNGV
jgi:SseB protein N-terminal domain